MTRRPGLTLLLAAGVVGAVGAVGAATAPLAVAQDEPPRLAPRDDIQAPPRIPLHADPQVGDTLERTSEQRGVTTRERTTIVGRAGDGFVIERTGPAWGGMAMRLVVDRGGRTREAGVGMPGARALAPVGVAVEPPGRERTEGREDVTAAGRTFRCDRLVIDEEDPIPLRSIRWVVAEGAHAGLVVAQESQVAGRTTRIELVSLEETRVAVGDREVPCLHVVRRPLLDGVPSPPVEEWVALRPLLFGETLVKLDNGLGVTRVTVIARDGRTVFPDLPAREGAIPR